MQTTDKNIKGMTFEEYCIYMDSQDTSHILEI
jgi:hypothetical protein